MDSECRLGTFSNPIVIGDGSPALLPARSPVKIVDGDHYRYLKVLALYMMYRSDIILLKTLITEILEASWSPFMSRKKVTMKLLMTVS